MKQLFYIVSLLTLLCCSNHPEQIIIRGRFAHLEQGEFFIYCSQGGGTAILDTLHIQDGEFTYETHLDAPAVLQILYPNYSQLAVFATPGDNIELKGDAQHLNAVEAKGNKDNEIYTTFRKETEGLPTKKTIQTARNLILENPTLAVSKYIFSQYYLLSDSTSAKETQEIYDSLCKACPEDASLRKLHNVVQAHNKLKPGNKLPDFALCTRKNPFSSTSKSDTIRCSDYKGKYLLMIFWAGWKSGSQSALYRARKLRREMLEKGNSLSIISYSLDTDAAMLRDIEKRDSINYPSYCDYQAFNSELTRKWHIRQIPYFILVDTSQRIIASGTDWQHDIEPKTKQLCL